MHLFKFKPSLLDFPDDGPLTVKYTGVGYDPILYEDSAVNDNEKSGHSFVRAWV
ncbi:hypothetical protein H8D85_02160 [bacterium]|nr:hypothetical protein [bacterium]